MISTVGGSFQKIATSWLLSKKTCMAALLVSPTKNDVESDPINAWNGKRERATWGFGFIESVTPLIWSLACYWYLPSSIYPSKENDCEQATWGTHQCLCFKPLVTEFDSVCLQCKNKWCVAFKLVRSTSDLLQRTVVAFSEPPDVTTHCCSGALLISIWNKEFRKICFVLSFREKSLPIMWYRTFGFFDHISYGISLFSSFSGSFFNGESVNALEITTIGKNFKLLNE